MIPSENPELFREFVPFLAIIMSNWPKETTFTPANVSSQTFAARLRDAMYYGRKYLPIVSEFDIKAFDKLRPSMQVLTDRPTKGVVTVCQKADVMNKYHERRRAEIVASDQRKELSNDLGKLELYQIHFLARLISLRIAIGPVKFTLQNEVDKPFVLEIPETFDCLIDENEDQTFTIS